MEECASIYTDAINVRKIATGDLMLSKRKHTVFLGEKKNEIEWKEIPKAIALRDKNGYFLKIPKYQISKLLCYGYKIFIINSLTLDSPVWQS